MFKKIVKKMILDQVHIQKVNYFHGQLVKGLKLKLGQ